MTMENIGNIELIDSTLFEQLLNSSEPALIYGLGIITFLSLFGYGVFKAFSLLDMIKKK